MKVLKAIWNFYREHRIIWNVYFIIVLICTIAAIKCEPEEPSRLDACHDCDATHLPTFPDPKY